MCYSAEAWQDYNRYVRDYDAHIDIKTFVKLFWQRNENSKVKMAKGMEAAFMHPKTGPENEILTAIEAFRTQQTSELEQEVFKQRQRLADAERTLQTKMTKAATESKRIAGNKIEGALKRLSDLRRTNLVDQDSRIYPGYMVPVMVMEGGQRVIKPMRYQCRPAGKPVLYDFRYPGTYNARRDNLEGFWRGQFGVTHGVMVINAFYEHVTRPRQATAVGGETSQIENVILKFKPRPAQDMLVACLWSHWTGPDEPDLLSFAAITDEPPAEVAAAGHDRCIIPIKPEHLDAWLNPEKGNLEALYAILDDRERPYYENRLAA